MSSENSQQEERGTATKDVADAGVISVPWDVFRESFEKEGNSERLRAEEVSEAQRNMGKRLLRGQITGLPSWVVTKDNRDAGNGGHRKMSVSSRSNPWWTGHIYTSGGISRGQD